MGQSAVSTVLLDALHGAVQPTAPRWAAVVIATTFVGIGFLLVVAVAVGVLDPQTRRRGDGIATDRRQHREARQPEFRGIDPGDVDAWDDD